MGTKKKTALAPPRVAIEKVAPEIDGGRYAAKRIVGDRLRVEADIFADGHELLAGILQYRLRGERAWQETPLRPLGNDRWFGEFPLESLGFYEYTLKAWIDPFSTWKMDLEKKLRAGLAEDIDYSIGAQWIQQAARRAPASISKALLSFAKALQSAAETHEDKILQAFHPRLAELMRAFPDKASASAYDKILPVEVDREKARFSAWYEFFPRSAASVPGRHGSFKDCEARLAEIAELGFDVVYFPPIHPIGSTARKGKNGSVRAGKGEPGSPWAIGSEEGGHCEIHPELGSLEDFRSLVAKAESLGLELALDLAYQCSPDHPYVREHPEWFKHRPDGSIQYAENPPKKYQDIYPLDFEGPHWAELWKELKRIADFWIEEGIRIFRVDNPHTKPFAFWSYLIGEIKKEHPEVLFLSEAFTRPKIMYHLAKRGFTQSYTYFAWRNGKRELEEYFTELTRGEPKEFFRPNLWPNTPDILTEFLQSGGRPAFALRLVLAATLGANYGVYGPAFELCEARPREAGSEEYLNSEKYELKAWDTSHPKSLRPLLKRLNQIRRENPALQRDESLAFHATDHEHLICYSKRCPDSGKALLVVVNLSPFHTHEGWVQLSLPSLGLRPDQSYEVRDLLSGESYAWKGARNYVKLNPEVAPAHLFQIDDSARPESDAKLSQ